MLAATAMPIPSAPTRIQASTGAQTRRNSLWRHASLTPRLGLPTGVAANLNRRQFPLARGRRWLPSFAGHDGPFAQA